MEEGTNEQIVFGIIASAGEARSKAYEALELAKEGRFDEADAIMAEANEASVAAHNIQTELLTHEAQGDHATVDVLLVHAQDHLMTSILALELINELIGLYRRIDAR